MTNVLLSFTSEFIKTKFYRLNTTILNGRPLQKFDAKMMKVIKICSKNSTNKDSHEVLSENDEKFISCKEARNIYKKFHFYDQKLLGPISQNVL